ncbi:MAG: tryptophan-rich sensory protein [Bacillus sp. (in: firmicutes)]
MGSLLTNIITFIAVIIVNILSNAGKINGQTMADISNKLDVYITPAGFTFSIWSLIYLMVIIWVLRQIPKKRRYIPVYKEATPYFVASNVLNIAWVFTWSYEYFLVSILVIIGLLLSMIGLYNSIKRINHTFWDIAPFSLYVGWVTVATIVNIAYYLVYIDGGGFNLFQTTWTIFALLAAAAISLMFRYKQLDWLYPLVTVWAFYGIGMKNLDGHAAVAYTAFGLAVIIFIANIVMRRKKPDLI